MSLQFNAEIENALQSLIETYQVALEFGDEGKFYTKTTVYISK